VDLDCARCGSHTVAIVTSEMDDADGLDSLTSRTLTLTVDELPSTSARTCLRPRAR
jgi:hypothetical protein